jgi:riboflavin synthase alpha subunit
MFTGIVQCTGVVADVRGHAGGVRLRIESPDLAQHAKPGDSICISGVCLTVAALTPDQFEFDVIRETLDKTMLGKLRSKDRVNLEPSLRAGDRLDGHFVQGHVDGTATVRRVVANAEEYVLWLQPQRHLLPYIIPKGSIAMDGVSLTVAAIDSGLFSVALIPTTLERTTLARLQTGDAVNIESDMMVRTIVLYLQQLLGPVDDGVMTAAPFSQGALREVVFGSLPTQGVP